MNHGAHGMFLSGSALPFTISLPGRKPRGPHFQAMRIEDVALVAIGVAQQAIKAERFGSYSMVAHGGNTGLIALEVNHPIVLVAPHGARS